MLINYENCTVSHTREDEERWVEERRADTLRKTENSEEPNMNEVK